MTRAGIARVLWGVVLGACAVLLVKAFVLDVYRVDSGSMEPTIHGSPDDGDYVLVRYVRAPALERFDLAVILRTGEREPVVKRVVGLPGETVRVRGDDLFINGKRLPPSAARPEPIPIFDSRAQDLELEFEHGERELARSGESWRIDASDAPAWLAYRRRIMDDHFDASQQRVEGLRSVGDAAIETTLRIEAHATTASLAWSLTEDGDRFRARLALSEGGAHVALERQAPGASYEVLAERTLAFDRERRHELRFSNIDNVLALDCDGERLILATYDQNAPLTGMADESARQRLPRARLDVDGGAIELARVRILRDVYYTEHGEHGTLEPTLPLGPDEIFVLGDNSAESRDSREWGPVKLGEGIGVPLAVVWPPGGIRELAGARAPPLQRSEAAPR